ncbi:MAG: endonuclease MutS2 [Firmicutes bacterium]|nr:endonuclease MutS2 [Bacillota bacterium]
MNERILRLLEYAAIRERVIAECTTPYGREWAQALAPLQTLHEAQTAMAGTVEGAAIYRVKGTPPFPLVADIRPALGRVRVGGVASAEQLLAVAITANRARQMARFVADVAERTEIPMCMSMIDDLGVAKALEDEILACIDEDGMIMDRASAQLSQIRSAMRTVQARMKRTLEEMVRSAQWQKFLQDTIVTMRADRYCLAVRADSQQQVKGVVHDASASGQTVYIEPERVLQLGNELRALKADEEREVERILAELSQLVSLHEEKLRSAVEAIGQIDFMLAKARSARKDEAVEPILSARQVVHLRAGRHPLLDRDRVVALDVSVGDGFHLLIITGPNTGGKTVTLKTIGLLTLMALSGLFVPALEGTEIGFFTDVFADIGDEQSIEQNLSTFSSHMTHIVEILQTARRDSLVLFDELGAGTDPTEGAALAVAILDELRLRGVCTVATTHYSELKAYAYTTPDTMNASVEFDLETLAPTYRLLMGVPGKSNAFAISRRLGLPDALIRNAQQQLSTQDVRVEDLIAQLQSSVLAARAEQEGLREARQAAQAHEQELFARLSHEQEERDRRRHKAEEEARALVRTTHREIEALLAELREDRAHGRRLKDHEISERRKRMEGLAPDRGLATSASTKARRPVQTGDEVRVLTLGGQKGTVLEISEQSQDALVAIGAMKVKVGKDQLELLRKASKIAAPAVMVTRVDTGSVGGSLDLRGTQVEEGIQEVDRYLDRAILSGFHQVTIIHGKGTGVLRRGIMAYLREHSRVRSARPGGEGEGGSGVTVVELR